MQTVDNPDGDVSYFMVVTLYDNNVGWVTTNTTFQYRAKNIYHQLKM